MLALNIISTILLLSMLIIGYKIGDNGSSRKEWIFSSIFVVVALIVAAVVLYFLEEPFFKHFNTIMQLIICILAIFWFILKFDKIRKLYEGSGR